MYKSSSPFAAWGKTSINLLICFPFLRSIKNYLKKGRNRYHFFSVATCNPFVPGSKCAVFQFFVHRVGYYLAAGNLIILRIVARTLKTQFWGFSWFLDEKNLVFSFLYFHTFLEYPDSVSQKSFFSGGVFGGWKNVTVLANLGTLKQILKYLDCCTPNI